MCMVFILSCTWCTCIVCLCQLDCAEIVLRTIREVSDAWSQDGITDVPVSLNDCDKLIEKYAKLALDFSAADHCNEPGEYYFLSELVQYGIPVINAECRAAMLLLLTNCLLMAWWQCRLHCCGESRCLLPNPNTLVTINGDIWTMKPCCNKKSFRSKLQVPANINYHFEPNLKACLENKFKIKLASVIMSLHMMQFLSFHYTKPAI